TSPAMDLFRMCLETGLDVGGTFDTVNDYLSARVELDGFAKAGATPSGAQVRVGGQNIPQPQKTKDVKPVYPAIARSARVQGVVIIEATMDSRGQVQDARVLAGELLLQQAAVDAVRQWEFTPTLVDSVPTPVIMTVTVTFGLQ